MWRELAGLVLDLGVEILHRRRVARAQRNIRDGIAELVDRAHDLQRTLAAAHAAELERERAKEP